jgi:hypothetical protein
MTEAQGYNTDQFKNYQHVNVSLPRGAKKGTLDFRQHTGTLDTVEIDGGSGFVRICSSVQSSWRDLEGQLQM